VMETRVSSIWMPSAQEIYIDQAVFDRDCKSKPSCRPPFVDSEVLLGRGHSWHGGECHEQG
jgi:hypothetical protein